MRAEKIYFSWTADEDSTVNDVKLFNKGLSFKGDHIEKPQKEETLLIQLLTKYLQNKKDESTLFEKESTKSMASLIQHLSKSHKPKVSHIQHITHPNRDGYSHKSHNKVKDLNSRQQLQQLQSAPLLFVAENMSKKGVDDNTEDTKDTHQEDEVFLIQLLTKYLMNKSKDDKLLKSASNKAQQVLSHKLPNSHRPSGGSTQYFASFNENLYGNKFSNDPKSNNMVDILNYWQNTQHFKIHMIFLLWKKQPRTE